MGQAYPLAPYIYALAGYLVLQVALNIILRIHIKRSANRARAMLVSTFWAGALNAVYFIAAAVWLHAIDAAPNASVIPANLWAYALIGIPTGALVWYISVMARKLGLAIFGGGELIASEDAILRVPPSPRYIAFGMVNIALLQPISRELFLRGAFFPAVSMTIAQDTSPLAGWLWGIACTMVIELLLRLNIVWIFQTLAYALVMCVTYLMTGNALAGTVAAVVAGLLHGVALAYIGQKEARRRFEEETNAGSPASGPSQAPSDPPGGQES
jgi:uncharacterized membrane protein